VGDHSRDRVKVRFQLEQDADGWPPTTTEGVWAIACGDSEYELDNVPWFVRGVACGDRVRAELDEEGILWANERVRWSGHYTIRVIPLGEGSSEAAVQNVIDSFAPLGVACEGGLPAFKIVALDIPPSATVSEIKALLREGEASGRWGYEEGCIDDRWVGQ
jgi:Domain of unknown function (DUF4265)